MVEADEAKLLLRLRQNPRAIPVLLTLTEEAFLDSFMQQRDRPAAVASLTREDIAAATSYALARFDKRFKLRPADFVIDLEDNKNRAAAADVILGAHCLRSVREFEAPVFRFGYTVTLESEGKFRISPPTHQLGMSLEFGYLRTEMLAHKRRSNLLTEEAAQAMSFFEFCRKFEENVQGASPSLYEVTPGPRPRLRLLMRSTVAEVLTEKVFTTRALFAEEVVHLADTCYELQTNPEDLSNVYLADDLTMLDFFNLSRIIRFYATLRIQELRRLRDDDNTAYSRSVVGGGTYDDLVANLAYHGIPHPTIDAFVKFVTWNAGADEYLDVQYSPVLRVGDIAAIMYATYLHANLFRNAFFHAKRRLYDDGAHDPVSNALRDALLSQGVVVRDRWKYRFGQIQGDVDVLAMMGDCLFVFECKNTMHPCNAFEQRTLFDHLDKATEQLDKFKELWGSGSFRRYLAKSLGWNVDAVARLRTAVVPSVRLLSGIDYNEHPVRHVRELVNFIETGRGELSFEGKDYEFDFWQGAGFGPSVLERYLSASNPVYDPIWEASAVTYAALRGPRWTVMRPLYGFHPETYVRAVERVTPLKPIARRVEGTTTDHESET